MFFRKNPQEQSEQPKTPIQRLNEEVKRIEESKKKHESGDKIPTKGLGQDKITADPLADRNFELIEKNRTKLTRLAQKKSEGELSEEEDGEYKTIINSILRDDQGFIKKIRTRFGELAQKGLGEEEKLTTEEMLEGRILNQLNSAFASEEIELKLENKSAAELETRLNELAQNKSEGKLTKNDEVEYEIIIDLIFMDDDKKSIIDKCKKELAGLAKKSLESEEGLTESEEKRLKLLTQLNSDFEAKEKISKLPPHIQKLKELQKKQMRGELTTEGREQLKNLQNINDMTPNEKVQESIYEMAK